jgi:hypothetical protein
VVADRNEAKWLRDDLTGAHGRPAQLVVLSPEQAPADHAEATRLRETAAALREAGLRVRTLTGFYEE